MVKTPGAETNREGKSTSELIVEAINSTDPRRLDDLAHTDIVEVQRQVAINMKTGEDTHEYLARNRDREVQENVAFRTETPKILEELAKQELKYNAMQKAETSDDWNIIGIVRRILQNPATPDAVITLLYNASKKIKNTPHGRHVTDHIPGLLGGSLSDETMFENENIPDSVLEDIAARDSSQLWNQRSGAKKALARRAEQRKGKK